MFSESNQTVSDLILMMLAMILKFNYTREHQTALINFARFNTWNCSPYLLSKAVSSQKENLKRHYYCQTCDIILCTMLLSAKKKFSLRC